MKEGFWDTFTAVACLFGIAAILSFVNDRFLRLQHDIGLLLLAGLTTGGLRVLERFIPSGVIEQLHQLTQSFSLNDTLLKGVLRFLLFRGSMRVSWATLREQRWLVFTSVNPMTPLSHPAGSPPETGQPAMHAIHNARLQQLMDQMNTLVYGQLSNELAAIREKHLLTQEMAATAGELSGTVKTIVATLPTLHLNDHEQESFVALANKLNFHAQQLETQAKRGEIQAIPETADEITLTCSACHALFRKSQNLLDRCRDSRHTC